MSPQGWFPDPSGRFGQRWFDGNGWTDWVIGANGAQVRDALPSTGTPGPTGTFGPAEPGGPPRYRPGAGLVLSGIGLALVALSLFALKWTAADKSTFLDLSKAVRMAGSGAFHDHAEYLYVAWAGFVLFAVALVFALLATIPLPGSAAGNRYSRIVASVAAGAAGVLHVTVMTELFRGHTSDAKPGSWLAVVGYVLVMIGMILGARRVATRSHS